MLDIEASNPNVVVVSIKDEIISSLMKGELVTSWYQRPQVCIYGNR